jgi:hypothetical protein
MKRFIQTFRISFLFFIVFTCSICCQRPTEKTSATVVSKNGKAVGVVIRGVGVKEKDLSNRIKIQLIKSGERVPILGEFKVDGRDAIFEPLVPLTRGLKYEILLDGEFFSAIEIPTGDFDAPELLSIYPSQDTLPENLLKMYLHFSEPMVEGSSLEHITFLRSNNDTLHGTFLDLKPELWNAEGTVLTLWLDPGRIKRDLIPNQTLGSPLRAFEKYILQISASWPGKNGLLLRQPFTKTFITTQRDDISPQPQRWNINIPASETNDPLEINFQEPLDYFLSKETFRIFTLKKEVSGNIEMARNEMVLLFIPEGPWQKGKYSLEIESRLEDLAGNNLNRPFDRDVENKDQTDDKALFIREFTIQ